MLVDSNHTACHPANKSLNVKKFIAVHGGYDIDTAVTRTEEIVLARHRYDVPLVQQSDDREGLRSLEYLFCRFKIEAARKHSGCHWHYRVSFAAADIPYGDVRTCRCNVSNSRQRFEALMKEKLTGMAVCQPFTIESLKFHCYDRPTATKNGFMELADIFNLISWGSGPAPFGILADSVPFSAAVPEPPIAAVAVAAVPDPPIAAAACEDVHRRAPLAFEAIQAGLKAIQAIQEVERAELPAGGASHARAAVDAKQMLVSLVQGEEPLLAWDGPGPLHLLPLLSMAVLVEQVAVHLSRNDVKGAQSSLSLIQSRLGVVIVEVVDKWDVPSGVDVVEGRRKAAQRQRVAFAVP